MEYIKGDFLVGFLLALPFFFIDRYALPTILSATVPLLFAWLFFAMDAFPLWLSKHTFVFVLGCLAASQLRWFWLLVRLRRKNKAGLR
jgi:hypothetical protein